MATLIYRSSGRRVKKQFSTTDILIQKMQEIGMTKKEIYNRLKLLKIRAEQFNNQ